MRVATTWKLMFFGLGIASILPLLAQTPPIGWTPPKLPSGPTQAQKDLLDQIQGVGALKFGAKLESFDKDSLKPINLNPGQPASPALSFQYLKEKGISWGTLQPSSIELGFYYGQLTWIRLRFNQENGDLIAVNNALEQKYGKPLVVGVDPVEFADSLYGGNGSRWNGSRIMMTVIIPAGIPVGVYAEYLKQKNTGAVEIIDHELSNKISREKLDAAQQELLKSHDLEKIKADL